MTNESQKTSACGETAGVGTGDLLAALRRQLKDGDYGLIQVSEGDPELRAVDEAIQLREVVREYLKYSSIDGKQERQPLRKRMAELSSANIRHEPTPAE